MATINPNLLQETPPKSNGAARNGSVSMMVLMKNAIMSAFQNSILNVRMHNEKELQADIKKVINLLEQFATAQKNLEIGKASLTTQTVDEFRVANLEELKLENVESLALAVEQLNPIIKSLQSSAQSDKQTIGLITKLLSQVQQLNSNMSSLAKKELRVPDKQVISGTVEVSRMPDAQGQIVAGLTKLETILKNLVAVNTKTDTKQQRIELAEGKTILEKLDTVADALQKLPGNMEFPTHVQVDNFPPQKYPNPVTNININPLRGSAKSRNITVGTSATPLPDEILAYRRSIIIYNNGASAVYIGGSDVTATNGLPVPAGSYSPALDAGPKMVIYGISASGNLNIRVLEVSNENIGG